LAVGDRPPSATLVPYLTIVAEARSRRALLNLLDLLDLCESDATTPTNRIIAAEYAKIAAQFSPAGCAYYGWLLQNGIGIPINFTESCEFFQKAADGRNADGANCLAICLDRGIGIDQDIARAASYYRFAASQKHAAGMNNFGRCLEYGQGVERNLLRAAKYYRMAADLKNADGANNFGICLERGIGVRVNLELAAEYYRRAADHGHADGANNFGFCLEHGRGVNQNIQSAADYYKRAADRGHPEADVGYRRCLRLLGRWSVPDRSSQASTQTPSLTEHEIIREEPFEAALSAFAELKAAAAAAFGGRADDLERGETLGQGELGIVKLARNRHAKGKWAVKTPWTHEIHCLERERAIYEELKHPLILGFAEYLPKSRSRLPEIVTEFVPNGSLADHLPYASEERAEMNALAGGTRIAIVITGIVLAMRYLHSLGIIHRELTPGSVLVDWEWIIRIGDFGHSLRVNERDTCGSRIAIDPRYTAPECFENDPTLKSDVFSFGAILYEVLTGNRIQARFNASSGDEDCIGKRPAGSSV
jgi:TPR repeat protein